MKFIVQKASDILPEYDEYREIKTIEDLMKLDKEFGEHGLIINFPNSKWPGYEATITIYDSYVE